MNEEKGFVPDVEHQKVNYDVLLYGRGFMRGGKHIPFNDVVIFENQIEIKSQAEKDREEQVERIAKSIAKVTGRWKEYVSLAIKMYDKDNVRIIGKDQRVVTPLSDEQIKEIGYKTEINGWGVFKVIRAVQRELGLEV